MNKKRDSSSWISLSDMMTGLMIVFLFLSILSIADVKKKEEEKNKIIKEYKNTRIEIYNDLNKTFSNKFEEWGVELDKDLTIRFTNPNLLFGFDSFMLKPTFKNILDEFIPKYINVINKKEYSKSIKEVRIEGHTSKELRNNFMYNIQLSQNRSNSVLDYIMNSEYFKNLSEIEKDKIKFWISANGLGFNRLVDSDNKFIFETKNIQNADKSRRVEFKILTNSDELLEKIINNK